MQSQKQAKVSKSYESPILRKLEPKEAQDFLLHHANLGDPGAEEILQLVSPKENGSK